MAFENESHTVPSKEPEVNIETLPDSLLDYSKSELIGTIKELYKIIETNESFEKVESSSRTSVTPSCKHTCKCIDCSSYCGDSLSDIKSTHSEDISLLVRKESSSSLEGTDLSKMKQDVCETKAMVEQIHKAMENLSK